MVNKGVLTIILICTAGLALSANVFTAEIYRVVDKDGNVTFTDQPPGDGSQPMDLPPLSVIETEKSDTSAQDVLSTAADDENAGPLRPADLRKMFRDFSITQPKNEETFWGTANSVFVSWGSSANAVAGMSARLFIDGEAQDVPVTGGLPLTLDRGEHKVYAQLLDAQNRPIVTSKTVTFFVKQNSIR